MTQTTLKVLTRNRSAALAPHQIWRQLAATGVALSLQGAAITLVLPNAAMAKHGETVRNDFNNVLFEQSKPIGPRVDFRNYIISFAALGGILGGVDSLHSGKTDAKPSEIEERFPEYSAKQLALGRKTVSEELSQVKASSENGRSMSVLDKFKESPLSSVQFDRVLSSLAAIRENYTNFRTPEGKMDGIQEKNWIHTQGELGRVLDSARAMKLTPAQTEDALLASMFSDSVKTGANFMVHHLDGAIAAQTFLSNFKDKEFTQERIDGIMQAIREHQIGPPEFMAMIYSNNIRSDINLSRGKELAALKGTPEAERTSEQTARLNQLQGVSDAFDARAGRIAAIKFSPKSPREIFEKAKLEARQLNGRFVTDDESAAIESLSAKISNPFSDPLVDVAGGGKAVQLTDLERTLLQRTGNSQWFVPNASNAWYGASRALINGDSIDNYATAGGFSKLLGLRGPETDMFFRDKTLDEALASPRQSSAQAYKIMTPEGQKMADAELANTAAAIERARARTAQWLRQQLDIPEGQDLPLIPYWNEPLKYPDRGAQETDYWRVHKIPAANRTPAEQEYWTSHRYKGLNEREVKDFQFAAKIRDHMVDELRKEQRVDGSLPPEFHPAMKTSASAAS